MTFKWCAAGKRKAGGGHHRLFPSARYRGLPKIETIGNFPFRWEPRIIETFAGERTVYDVIGELHEFGPEDVTGVFRWNFIAGELEPVLDPTMEPYPHTKAYTSVLEQWLLRNPYPGEEA